MNGLNRGNMEESWESREKQRGRQGHCNFCLSTLRCPWRIFEELARKEGKKMGDDHERKKKKGASYLGREEKRKDKRKKANDS